MKKEQCEIHHGKITIEGVIHDFLAFNSENKKIAEANTAFLNTDKKFVWLAELTVIPECRDKGVGTEMLQTIAETAKEANKELVYVYPGIPMDEKMPIATKSIDHFYEKNGFVSCNAPKDVATLTPEGLMKRGKCLKL